MLTKSDENALLKMLAHVLLIVAFVPLQDMWWLHGKILRSVAKAAVSGAAITVGSATVSCVFAIYIERTAHRVLFTYFPHWYDGVEIRVLDDVRTKPLALTTTATHTGKEQDRTTEMPWQVVETTVQQTLGLPSLSEQHMISCSMTS